MNNSYFRARLQILCILQGLSVNLFNLIPACWKSELFLLYEYQIQILPSSGQTKLLLDYAGPYFQFLPSNLYPPIHLLTNSENCISRLAAQWWQCEQQSFPQGGGASAPPHYTKVKVLMIFLFADSWHLLLGDHLFLKILRMFFLGQNILITDTRTTQDIQKQHKDCLTRFKCYRVFKKKITRRTTGASR